MKRILVIAVIMCVACGSAQALPRFNPGDVLYTRDLNAMVDQINSLSGTEPRTIPVDCAAGGTIGQALEQANPGDIIQVTGTCHEAVLIIKDGITLDGQGQTIVDGGGSQQSAITIDGAQRVTVQGLTVQHSGNHGVLARRGAAVILHTVTAMHNVNEGIRIDESATAQLIDCTASQNGRDGIVAFRASSITLLGTLVSQANARWGIQANQGSGVSLGPGAMVTVSDNRDHGILVGTSASFATAAVLTGLPTLVVQGNQGRGIVVVENSLLSFFQGTIQVQNNAAGGVQALRTSFVRFQSVEGAALIVQITGNQGRGVEIEHNSGAHIVGGTGVTIALHDNTGDGIGVLSDSSLDLQNVTVNHNGLNGGAGINLSLSTATLTNVQLLDHANDSGLMLNAGSRVTAKQLTVMNNSNPSIINAGIALNDKSSLNLSGTATHPSIVRGNQGTGGGLSLLNGSTANLNMVTISHHTDVNSFGLSIGTGSSVSANNVTIMNNAGGGISLFNAGSLTLSNSTVSNNQGTMLGAGLNIFTSSSADLHTVQISGHPNTEVALNIGLNSTVYANVLTVTHNGHRGIFIGPTSSFHSDIGLMVMNNPGGGIGVDESHIDLQNATVTHNGGTDINASFGSRLSFNAGNTIGTLFCQPNANVLSRGSMQCP